MYWYEVEYINMMDERQENAQGIVSGKTYLEATNELMEYLSDCPIISLYLTELDNPLDVKELKDILQVYPKEDEE